MADSSYLTKIVEPFVVDWVSRHIGTTLTPQQVVVIRQYVRRRHGVYALYRRGKLQYVGLASGSMGSILHC